MPVRRDLARAQVEAPLESLEGFQDPGRIPGSVGTADDPDLLGHLTGVRTDPRQLAD